MKKEMGLHEISEYFAIPKATLLYWEKEGLIHFQRNPENNYRQITPKVLFEIENTSNYRDMGMPVALIRSIPCMSLDEMDCTFKKMEQKLSDQMDRLERSRQRAEVYRQHFAEIRRLTEAPYQDEAPDFQRVSVYKEAHWHVANKNPDQFVLLAEDPAHLTEGFIDNGESDLLWEAGNSGIQWKSFILKVKLENGQRKSNDLEEHIGRLERKGYCTGLTVARYWAEAMEADGFYGYYKAWIQVHKPIC